MTAEARQVAGITIMFVLALVVVGWTEYQATVDLVGRLGDAFTAATAGGGG